MPGPTLDFFIQQENFPTITDAITSGTIKVPQFARTLDVYLVAAGASGGTGNAAGGGGGGGGGGASHSTYILTNGDWGAELTWSVGDFPNSSYVSGAFAETYVSVKALSGNTATGIGERTGGIGGTASGGDELFTGNDGADGDALADGGAGGIGGAGGSINFGGVFPGGVEQSAGSGGNGEATPGGAGTMGASGVIAFIWR